MVALLPHVQSIQFLSLKDPTVTVFDINAKSNYVDNVCKPIASKKAPKVEPPKEEKKPDS